MFALDPEVGAAMVALLGPVSLPTLAVGDVAGRRAQLAAFFEVAEGAREATTAQPTDVETKDFFAKASDGHSIICRWYTKANTKPPGSAIVYIHGGGMIALTIEDYDNVVRRYVSHTGVPFLVVDYRLAPEVQAPVPVTDSYAGLEYLHSHAAKLGVDPSRIAIMGDSAGGGIAASLAHYAKLQRGPPICKQILIYPMLDDRNLTLDPALAPFVTWSNDDNITGWTGLLGSRVGGPDVKVIEAAGRMTMAEAEGLPPAYIDVGELDIFRDEDLEYARTLRKAQVSCELHLIPGVNHAFEVAAPHSQAALLTIARREKAVLSI